MMFPTPLSQSLELSLALQQAAYEAGIPPHDAKRFLAELVALPGDAAERVLAEVRRERTRNTNRKTRRRR